MSHTAKKQASDRKHGPPPDSDDDLMYLLDCIRSGKAVAAAAIVAHVAAGDVPVELFTTDIREV
jgi:hypothetical protein